jgi:hypothetical protein
MISSHCFPETQFIAVTAYQNEEVRQPGRERRREGKKAGGNPLSLGFFFWKFWGWGALGSSGLRPVFSALSNLP